MKRQVVLGIMLLLFTQANVVSAQDLDERFSMFEEFVGERWVGHFVGTRDSNIVHTVIWEAILGGKAVKKTKLVPEVDFTDETTFYWDEVENAVVFVSLTNRGQVSRGVVAKDGDRVVMSGASVSRAGQREFRLSFLLRPDGTLEDIFENVENGAWRQGHLIVYERAAAE